MIRIYATYVLIIKGICKWSDFYTSDFYVSLYCSSLILHHANQHRGLLLKMVDMKILTQLIIITKSPKDKFSISTIQYLHFIRFQLVSSRDRTIHPFSIFFNDMPSSPSVKKNLFTVNTIIPKDYKPRWSLILFGWKTGDSRWTLRKRLSLFSATRIRRTKSSSVQSKSTTSIPIYQHLIIVPSAIVLYINKYTPIHRDHFTGIYINT